MNSKKLDLIIGFQGIYYLVTAIWPLIHLDSFIAIVGPKADMFQFYTTMLLIIVIALALLLSLGHEKTKSTLALAIFSPIAFIIVEFAFRNAIRPVFFLDFAIEAFIFFALLFTIYLEHNKPTE
jgi:hypothetical protein